MFINNGELPNDMIGKNVRVYYEDGTGRVSRINGIVTKYTDEIILDENVIIPKHRIVRIELS